MASPSYGSPDYSPSPAYYGDDGSDGDTGMEEQEQHAEDEADEGDSSLRLSETSFVGDMTMDRTGALDCGVCFLPLKPPLFQCDVGHVVCSPCQRNLAAAAIRRCPVCRGRTSFRRCYAMEQVVDSVRVSCLHAARGCAARPAYHSRDSHAAVCAYAPHSCPADGCGFAGPTAALLEHFDDAHCWPRTAEAWAECGFVVRLRDGFNFLTAIRDGSPDHGTVTREHVFLLNVARAPFGRTVSAVCLRPLAATCRSSSSSPVTTTTECELELSYSYYKSDSRRRMHHRLHSQTSRFEVPCMDPFDGLPDPNVLFQFVIPNYIPGHDDDACK
ncbi:hypothetical protein EJB05_13681, partial [Eragrostis curvula]